MMKKLHENWVKFPIFMLPEKNMPKVNDALKRPVWDPHQMKKNYGIMQQKHDVLLTQS